MATSNRLGFEEQKNLSESINDVSALNNLGGGNISADLSLFSENTKATSELTWKFGNLDSKIENDKFVFQRSQLFVFTNGDKIINVEGPSLGNLSSGTTYYVVEYERNLGDRRTQLAFGLSTTPGGSKISLGSIGGDVKFTRKDEVTQENLLKIALPESESASDNLIDDEISTFTYNISGSFNNTFNEINSNINLFNFLRNDKYAFNFSISTENSVNVEGTISIDDPANTNDSQSDLDLDNSPGLFITNPFSPLGTFGIEKTRAFSTSQNPWDNETFGKLTTKSTEVNIGNLFFQKPTSGQDGITINDFNGISAVSASGSVSSAYTHKLPILVNGIEYFVLVKV